jgi:outer membrane protein assembly factor BamB
VSFTRGSAVWARRALLAAVLIGAALVPGRAASTSVGRCRHARCQHQVAAVLWSRRLPGSWAAQSGALGTVPSQGQADAAVGNGLAVVGFGATVLAYRLSDGEPLWTADLAGFPVGSAIVSVRAWPGVVTAGVSVPGATGSASRDEVVLSAATGHRIRAFPAAAYGGAVQASAARTVIVGTSSVTSYANNTGRVVWRRRTGSVAQAWRVDGDDLLLTEARGGYLGTAPVTALRSIDLRTGAQSIVRPAGRSFAGALSGAVGGVVLFSGAAGLTAYSADDGAQLWARPQAVPQVVDAARQVVYVVSGNALIGLDPLTGHRITRAATPGAGGLYAISNGVALGLDQGALGDAWGYDLARNKVIWTTRAIPWPHFFLDLSGIGGSADPSGRTIVLASCAQVGTATASATPPPCLRPRLVAISLAEAARETGRDRVSGTGTSGG